MAKKPPSDFQTVAPISRIPKLLFPSIDDNNIFGMDIENCSKNYAINFNKNKIAKEFWRQYQTSNNIIIIDDYFYKIPIEYIKCLKDEAQLKIYTGRKINIAKVQLQQIVGKNIFLFQITEKLKIHDRFAILDGELFHFGSTVGGHEEHFTSYSRGWESKKISGLLEFLDSKECLYENFIKEVKL